MVLREEKRNLFDVGAQYSFAHCISSDCAMGAGIAVDFQKKFHLKQVLLQYTLLERKHPTCIFEKNVFNLITKEKYSHKPTYNTLQGSLNTMRKLILNNDIHYVAMPKIGCGLDKLQWGKVREMIFETFKDIEDLEILVCYI
jgi:hypothetical protein